ncbi:hypothetical protein MXD61_05990, partial [Frankia sp. AgPm24]|uniref:hypothetical protein n=1 Tax=Frankia sp. AgPm24 TaxID=631128 RepID=UPI00200F8231
KAGPPPNDGPRAQTTRERWAQVHDLLDQGVGLLDCARRLNLSLNIRGHGRACGHGWRHGSRAGL